MHEVLVSQIERAFAGIALPEGLPLSVETYDDEGADANFRGRRWRDLGYGELKDLTPCLSFFTPGAFCYFLPGFLLASLAQPTSWFAGDVANRLCPPKNDPTRASYAAWWRLLSGEQRKATAAFLHHMQRVHGAIPQADLSCLDDPRDT
jgi:hypothetical protein